MKCFAEEIYSAYLDDELPWDQARTIEEHVRNCSICSAKVDVLKEEMLMIRESFASDLRIPDLMEDIEKRIKTARIPAAFNGTWIHYFLSLTLVISSFLFPLFAFYQFKDAMGKLREVLSFFITPISILFNLEAASRDQFFRARALDLPSLSLFLSLMTVAILFFMNFLFKDDRFFRKRKEH